MTKAAPHLAPTKAINIANRSPAPKPPPESYRPHQGPKIAAAIEALWPRGIPKWISPARRDWEIQNFIWEQGENPPCERTIRRFFASPS